MSLSEGHEGKVAPLQVLSAAPLRGAAAACWGPGPWGGGLEGPRGWHSSSSLLTSVCSRGGFVGGPLQSRAAWGSAGFCGWGRGPLAESGRLVPPVSGRARIQARSPAPLQGVPPRPWAPVGETRVPQIGAALASLPDARTAPRSPVRLPAPECGGSGSSSPAPSVTAASARVPARVSETTCTRCSA